MMSSQNVIKMPARANSIYIYQQTRLEFYFKFCTYSINIYASHCTGSLNYKNTGRMVRKHKGLGVVYP